MRLQRLTLAVLLSACASTERARFDANRDRALDASKQLRIGMTYDEIASQIEPPANCQGHPANLAVCELIYQTGFEDPYKPRAGYTTIRLAFAKNRLTDWSTIPARYSKP